MWDKSDILKILQQLEKRNLPFSKFTIFDYGGNIHLIGKGAFSRVYAATDRERKKKKYAIKVSGFEGNVVNEKEYRKNANKIKKKDNDSVLKVYGYVQLRVWLSSDNDVKKVEVIDNKDGGDASGDFLNLYFLAMEYAKPVIKKKKNGEIELYPKKLQKFDIKEILKLTEEVGIALQDLHSDELIHRDVKLENIFYSETNKCYKIGDFGSSKITSSGFAETTVYTNGYGAPEVKYCTDGRYDKTADIYSLGIVLYLLLNEMKYPYSDSYHANIKKQYAKGNVFPKPKNGSEELKEIVLKMCSFYPENRYQSLEEVILRFEKIGKREYIAYSLENNKNSLLLGSVFLIMGAVVWNLSICPNVKIKNGILVDIILLYYIYNSIRCYIVGVNEYRFLLNIFLGIVMLIVKGITIIKVLLVFVLATFDYFGGILAAMLLVLEYVPKIIKQYSEGRYYFGGYKWLAILLVMIAIMLFTKYLWFKNPTSLKMIHRLDDIFIFYYVAVLLLGISVNYNYKNYFMNPRNSLLKVTPFIHFWKYQVTSLLYSWRLDKVGGMGLLFMLVRKMRIYYLLTIDKRNKQK